MDFTKHFGILKEFMKRLKFPSQNCEMYSSEWFLANLLKKSNLNIELVTSKIRKIKSKIDLIEDMILKYRMTRSKETSSWDFWSFINNFFSLQKLYYFFNKRWITKIFKESESNLIKKCRWSLHVHLCENSKGTLWAKEGQLPSFVLLVPYDTEFQVFAFIW